jgi:hypothetical protein
MCTQRINTRFCSSDLFEVCVDPGLALGPRSNPALGPGLVAQILFGSGPGSGEVQMIAIKRRIEHFGLSWTILFFLKEQFIRSCAHLMLVTQSGSGNKFHQLDFLGDFSRCPLPEIVRDNTLKTWHPISLCRCPNSKIT